MGKLAQYRFLKKVKKMLETPVKNEETYDISSVPMYIGHKSFRSEKHENNPNHALRRTQVNEIASMILHQISRMGQWHDDLDDGDVSVTVDDAFIDIATAFAEFDNSMLFTDAEKAARRQQQPSRLAANTDYGPSLADDDRETLALLRLRIEGWQRENVRKLKKVSRIETTIRDLGLNVNDVRCAQILSEKKEAVAGLEASITAGASLCRQTWRQLEGMFAVTERK